MTLLSDLFLHLVPFPPKVQSEPDFRTLCSIFLFLAPAGPLVATAFSSFSSPRTSPGGGGALPFPCERRIPPPPPPSGMLAAPPLLLLLHLLLLLLLLLLWPTFRYTCVCQRSPHRQRMSSNGICEKRAQLRRAVACLRAQLCSQQGTFNLLPDGTERHWGKSERASPASGLLQMHGTAWNTPAAANMYCVSLICRWGDTHIPKGLVKKYSNVIRRRQDDCSNNHFQEIESLLNVVRPS